MLIIDGAKQAKVLVQVGQDFEEELLQQYLVQQIPPASLRTDHIDLPSVQ
jgi:type III secretion system FlhB-like substrate exporter